MLVVNVVININIVPIAQLSSAIAVLCSNFGTAGLVSAVDYLDISIFLRTSIQIRINSLFYAPLYSLYSLSP